MIRADKLVYDGIDKKLKVFIAGDLVYGCEARNDSVADNAWRAGAGCPPGTYALGGAETNAPGDEQTEMGPYFIPIYNIPGHDGIGIHGGGSCVAPNSMAGDQGWCPTMNCIRLQNINLTHIINSYQLDGVPLEVVQPA
jgi:hypothetical protein